MSQRHGSAEADRYILDAAQWPAGQTTITYSFNDYILASDGEREESLGLSLREEFRATVREAMETWEGVCGVEFVEVSDSTASNVRIGWQPQPSTTSDPNYQSDGVGNTAGITWTWFRTGAIIEQSVAFDLAESWNTTNFYDVALHELGHVLGIDHSNVENTVMSGLPTTPYADQPGRDALTTDDIAAARAIWGAPTGGNAGDDLIGGGNGDDTLLGGFGNDLLSGGADNDFLWGQNGHDTLDGGAGNDLVFGMEGDDVIDGGAGDDIVLAGPGDDAIRNTSGNDSIWGEGGDDTLLGGTGDEFLAGGSGNDSINGGAGDDNDYLFGEEGADTLEGGSGGDTLVGGAGDDVLIGSADGTIFFGQEGADVFVYRGGQNWVMDFDPIVDRLDFEGRTVREPTQVGYHVRVQLGDGDLYLAWTHLGELDDVLI